MQPEALSSTQPGRLRAPRRAIGIALVLGLAFEWLLDGPMPGVSVPIWVALCVAAMLGVTWLERVRPSVQGLLWPLLVLALAAVFPLRLEPLTVGLSVVLCLIALTMWVDTLVPGDLLRFGWLDVLRSALLTPWLMLIRPWAVLSDGWSRSVSQRGWRRPFFAVLRGVLLAIPVLVVFTALLASADRVFSDYVQDALRWLDLERLMELLSRILVVLLTGLLCLGALAVGLGGRRQRRLLGEVRPLVAPFLGATESLIVLGLLDLLFAAFVGIQFFYLFGGQGNIHAAGYTYAEYARRGFGELVFAAALSLGLVYLLAHVTRRETGPQRNGFNALAGLQVVLLGVVLASALHRLLLYESAYGFTRLRTYTHVAIAWIGVALIVFGVLLFLDRLRGFAPAAVLGAAGFALTLAWVNVDAFIVARNTERLAQTAKIDIGYLLQLTDDAVPGLAALTDAIPDEDRQMLLSDLSCRYSRLRRWQATQPWPSAHASRMRALETLEAMRPELEPYVVRPAVWGTWRHGPFVVGVGEDLYWCSGMGWD